MTDDEEELIFCNRCLSEIQSPRLFKFITGLCAVAVRELESLVFRDDDRLAIRYIQKLEERGYLISMDRGEFLLVRPLHLYEVGPFKYLLCKKPKEHFLDLI